MPRRSSTSWEKDGGTGVGAVVDGGEGASSCPRGGRNSVPGSAATLLKTSRLHSTGTIGSCLSSVRIRMVPRWRPGAWLPLAFTTIR